MALGCAELVILGLCWNSPTQVRVKASSPVAVAGEVWIGFLQNKLSSAHSTRGSSLGRWRGQLSCWGSWQEISLALLCSGDLCQLSSGPFWQHGPTTARFSVVHGPYYCQNADGGPGCQSRPWWLSDWAAIRAMTVSEVLPQPQLGSVLIKFRNS